MNHFLEKPRKHILNTRFEEEADSVNKSKIFWIRGVEPLVSHDPPEDVNDGNVEVGPDVDVVLALETFIDHFFHFEMYRVFDALLSETEVFESLERESSLCRPTSSLSGDDTLSFTLTPPPSKIILTQIKEKKIWFGQFFYLIYLVQNL